MLEVKEKITITGRSIIDGKEVCGFQANIDSEDPKNMSMSDWQINKELYKENRVACRADQAAFEDRAYAKQDELLAALTE